jgi:hypothetical protein
MTRGQAQPLGRHDLVRIGDVGDREE